MPGQNPSRRPAPENRPPLTLVRRIVGINLAGLLLFLVGIVILDETRQRLTDFRIRELENQGRIVAQVIATTADPRASMPRYDPKKANELLERLDLPVPVRIRLYNRDAKLTGDTRSLRGPRSAIREERLPTQQPLPTNWGDPHQLMQHLADVMYRLPTNWVDPQQLLQQLADLMDRLHRYTQPPPLYIEAAPLQGRVTQEAEVLAALHGETTAAVTANSTGETILSVAMPVRRYQTNIGALILSTEDGEIDGIVREARVQFLQIAIFAVLVSVGLSFWLARLIARPLHGLAISAHAVVPRTRLPIDTNPQGFKQHTGRKDDIGALARALQRMTDGLLTRIRATEAFAADVAHELKNPLTSLRSAVETLRGIRSETGRDRLLDVIESDVVRLDRLVTDISNFSRLDADMMRETFATFDLRIPARTVAELHAEPAQRKGVELQVDLPERVVAVSGIESRMAQVIGNLLSNAISFSPAGGVVRVQVKAGHPVRLIVEDQGPGIPEDRLEKIFERFSSHRPDSEPFGEHSGIGLSISRQIVETLGGSIRAERRAAGGARFVVELSE